VELLAASLVAVVLLPFALGWWIGHPVMAALPFVALGATVLLRQAQIGDREDHASALLLGIVLSTAFSTVAAYAGGRVRERGRRRS